MINRLFLTLFQSLYIKRAVQVDCSFFLCNTQMTLPIFLRHVILEEYCRNFLTLQVERRVLMPFKKTKHLVFPAT